MAACCGVVLCVGAPDMPDTTSAHRALHAIFDRVEVRGSSPGMGAAVRLFGPATSRAPQLNRACDLASCTGHSKAPGAWGPLGLTHATCLVRLVLSFSNECELAERTAFEREGPISLIFPYYSLHF